MTVLERIALEVAGGIAAIGAILLWWHLHNAAEQHQGAEACIQATTETKQAAVADAHQVEAAQAVDVQTVIRGYDAKVASLSSSNADLAQRLSARGAVRACGVSGAGPDPGAAPADRGLAGGQSQAAQGSAAAAVDVDADYKQLLAAGDACEVKLEGLTDIYQRMRDRAIAARAAAPAP